MCNAQQLVKEEVEVKKRQFSNLAASRKEDISQKWKTCGELSSVAKIANDKFTHCRTPSESRQS
jgi:hypothetical protein